MSETNQEKSGGEADFDLTQFYQIFFEEAGENLDQMEQMLRSLVGTDLDSVIAEQLGELLLAAQVGSLLDHRIAQLAVGGRDTGAEASARKLIGVRYRQRLEEFRMEQSDGGGIVHNDAVQSFLNTRCLSIAGGTEQILLTMAGERLLGLPR